VAPLKTRIISAEAGLVFVHQLLTPKISDAKCFQQALTLCKYRWVLKFKVDIAAPESLLAAPCSFIGDLFLALYPKSFCVWSKVPGKPFENVYCCYTAPDSPVPAKNALKLALSDPGEENLDSQVSTGSLSMLIMVDGRMIVVFAKKTRAVRIWFNQLFTTANESADSNEFGLDFIKLEHDSDVLLCKFKKQNFFETASKYIPNVLITFTSDYKVHLWIENLSQVRFPFSLKYRQQSTSTSLKQ